MQNNSTGGTLYGQQSQQKPGRTPNGTRIRHQRAYRKTRIVFSDIVGLTDEAADGIFLSGSLAGVVVASIAVAAAGKIADAHNRKHRIRAMNVKTRVDDKLVSLSVLKSTGDVLSQLYTEWLIARTPVTAENLHSLELSFGENLTLKQGMFTYEQRRQNAAPTTP